MQSPKQMIANLLTRAVVNLISQDESKGKIFAQVLGMAGEIRSDVEHLQQYGLRSIPLGGSRGLLVAYGGSKDNATLIVVDDKRYGKFTLQPGDVCIYSKNGAHTIYRGDDIIEILSGEKTITIGSMSITTNGSKHEIKIGGMTAKIDSSGLDVAGGDVVADGISLKGHAHPISSGSSAPGPTGLPV